MGLLDLLQGAGNDGLGGSPPVGPSPLDGLIAHLFSLPPQGADPNGQADPNAPAGLTATPLDVPGSATTDTSGNPVAPPAPPPTPDQTASAPAQPPQGASGPAPTLSPLLLPSAAASGPQGAPALSPPLLTPNATQPETADSPPVNVGPQGPSGPAPAATGPLGAPLRTGGVLAPSATTPLNPPMINGARGAPPMLTPPVQQPTNHVGDVLDELIGSPFRMAREHDFERQQQAYQVARNQQILGTITDPDQRRLFQADPAAWVKANETTQEARNTPGGDSVFLPGRGFVTAPKFVTDDKSGVTGFATPGKPLDQTGTFGGDVKLDPTTGALISSRTGDTGGRVPIPVKLGATEHLDQNTAGGNGPALAAGNGGAVAGFTPGPKYGGPAPGPGAGLNPPLLNAAPAPAAASAPAAPATGSVAAQILARPSVSALSPDDQTTLLATAKTESGFNPSAQNGRSTGVFQFQPKTFANLGGTNLNDLGQQTDAAAKLLLQNKAGLAPALGRTPTPSELYLAHQQGLPGAKAILTAPPGTNAIQALIGAGIAPAVAKKSILQNYGSTNTTTDQFASTWARKFGQRVAAVQGQSGAPAVPTGTGAPANPAAPADGPASPPVAGPGGMIPSTVTEGPKPAIGDVIKTADQIPNGKPGWTYKVNQATGEVTPIAPSFTMDHVQANRKAYYESEAFKGAASAVVPLKGLNDTVSSVAPGGVVTMAGVDTLSKALNPTGVVRPQTAKMFLDHLGLPEELHSKLLSVVGEGSLSPAVIKQIGQGAYLYARAHIQQAQDQVDRDTALATGHGFTPADVGESAPPIPTVPKWAQDVVPAPAARTVGKTYWTPNGPGIWEGPTKGWRKQ